MYVMPVNHLFFGIGPHLMFIFITRIRHRTVGRSVDE
jgi:hypothetical protein